MGKICFSKEACGEILFLLFLYIMECIPLQSTVFPFTPSFKQLGLMGLQPIFDC